MLHYTTTANIITPPCQDAATLHHLHPTHYSTSHADHHQTTAKPPPPQHLSWWWGGGGEVYHHVAGGVVVVWCGKQSGVSARGHHYQQHPTTPTLTMNHDP
mmetsp:Transcript_34396/g.74273  ORF Transcript_34396/g.74273 Transcript_34396/m.74273 type:complete len:101 (-) Transcript_34396:865-1167(-)